MSPAPSRSVRTALAACTLFYVVVAFWLLLAPVPDAASAGVGLLDRALAKVGFGWVSGESVEFLCNIAVFVPLPLLATGWWPRVSCLVWVVAGIAFSAFVELTQSALLPHRTGSWIDLQANATGAVFGGLLAWWWQRVGHTGPLSWRHERLRAEVLDDEVAGG